MTQRTKIKPIIVKI